MRTQIVVALDFSSIEEAVAVARSVAPHVAGFKVGYELLHGPEPHSVERIGELGLPVFADAKLHDIPATVEAGARQLGRRGARWVTAHAQGGSTMLAAAVEGLSDGSGGVGGVLVVSVLTSIGPEDMEGLGTVETVPEIVGRLAGVAARSGAEGMVCAVPEVAMVMAAAPRLKVFTPGIRLRGAAGDDQKRVATPESAAAAGADFIVVGRPITRSGDPGGIALQIADALA